MVVGEAPGPQESAQGSPFIGPSGAELESALRKVGVAGAYLTNVVKCLPPRSPAKPKAGEIKACRSYLDAEIAHIKPTAILALGETAWHRLGGHDKITVSEGKEIWSDKYDCWIMPARHPAAILRAQGMRSAWLLVLHRFARLTQGTLHDDPPVETRLAKNIDTALSVARDCLQASNFTYDFETTGLDWWAKDFQALSVAVSWEPGWAITVPLAHPESPLSSDEQRRFLDAFRIALVARKRKTAHNGLFDDLVAYRVTGQLPYMTCDTLALAHLLDENRPKGLKWLGRALLGWPDWGIDAKDLIKQPLDRVAHYNACDAAATFLLRDVLIEQLKQDDRLARYFAEIVMPGIRMVERIVANGIYADPNAVAERVTTFADKMRAAAATIPVENPGSNPQIATWLYEDLKLPIISYTKGGAPSTDEETINRLARRYPQAKNVLEYRGHAKNLNTYALPLYRMLDRSYDGRAHFDYRGEVETGRYSSRFHTTPRDEYVRMQFSAPPGRVSIFADYRQIEARLVAWAAAGKPRTWADTNPQRGRLLHAFKAGLDPYILMAARALGKPQKGVTKKERQEMGKVPTLACLYRISPQGLQEYAWKNYELDWTLAQAVHLHRSFYDLWSEIEQWHTYQEKILKGRGWTQTELGRKRRLPDAMGRGPGAYESINAGINMPIQGLASDITLEAGVIAQREIDSGDALLRNVQLIGYVHDSLGVEAPAELVSPVAAWLERTMLAAPVSLQRLGLFLPEGLIQAEVKAGPWGSSLSPDEYKMQFDRSNLIV